MAKFFETLAKEEYASMIPILDWLFDDNKFTSKKWDQELKTRFTKELKKIEGFNENTFRHKTNNDHYPLVRSRSQRKNKPYALFGGKSLGTDFVRHVRNGISHGHTVCYKSNGVQYVEIKDFYRGEQTAYITMPINYIAKMYEVYNAVQK